MKSSTPPPDDSWEDDAVWKLLDEAAPVKPRPSFADDLVRMAKLEPPAQPWWKRWLAPLPAAGMATAAAAVALGFTFLTNRATVAPDVPPHATVEQMDPYADLQDLAETEALIAAVDHLDDFSDQELGNLIGF